MRWERLWSHLKWQLRLITGSNLQRRISKNPVSVQRRPSTQCQTQSSIYELKWKLFPSGICCPQSSKGKWMLDFVRWPERRMNANLAARRLNLFFKSDSFVTRSPGHLQKVVPAQLNRALQWTFAEHMKRPPEASREQQSLPSLLGSFRPFCLFRRRRLWLFVGFLWEPSEVGPEPSANLSSVPDVFWMHHH